VNNILLYFIDNLKNTSLFYPILIIAVLALGFYVVIKIVTFFVDNINTTMNIKFEELYGKIKAIDDFYRAIKKYEDVLVFIEKNFNILKSIEMFICNKEKVDSVNLITNMIDVFLIQLKELVIKRMVNEIDLKINDFIKLVVNNNSFSKNQKIFVNAFIQFLRSKLNNVLSYNFLSDEEYKKYVVLFFNFINSLVFNYIIYLMNDELFECDNSRLLNIFNDYYKKNFFSEDEKFMNYKQKK
jgi:hypothetical protein